MTAVDHRAVTVPDGLAGEQFDTIVVNSVVFQAAVAASSCAGGKNWSCSAAATSLGRGSSPIAGSIDVRLGAARNQPATRSSVIVAATPPPNE